MLSIIIPVHNVEKYIGSLLSSILNAGFDEKLDEVIIVDDGSTDQTAERISVFGQNNKMFRYKLLTQKCKGVSNARNVGLKNATKDYVWFVDGDDLLPKRVLSFLHSIIAEKHPTVIGGGYSTVDEDAEALSLDHDFKELDEELNVGGAVFSTIVKRTVLTENQITFCEELAYGEDYLWSFLVNLFAEEKIFVSEIYGYRKSLNSAMRTSNKEKVVRRCQDMITLAEQYRIIGNRYDIDVKKRVSMSIQSVLFDSIFFQLDRKCVKHFLTDMKRKKLYPYSIMWKHIIPNTSLSHTLINYFTLLLPIEPVFWLCYEAVNIFKK